MRRTSVWATFDINDAIVLVGFRDRGEVGGDGGCGRNRCSARSRRDGGVVRVAGLECASFVHGPPLVGKGCYSGLVRWRQRRRERV